MEELPNDVKDIVYKYAHKSHYKRCMVQLQIVTVFRKKAIDTYEFMQKMGMYEYDFWFVWSCKYCKKCMLRSNYDFPCTRRRCAFCKEKSGYKPPLKTDDHFWSTLQRFVASRSIVTNPGMLIIYAGIAYGLFKKSIN